jgi:hypothetical protein
MTQTKMTWISVFALITGFALCALFTCNKEREYQSVISIAKQRVTADSLSESYAAKNASVEKKIDQLKKEKVKAAKNVNVFHAEAADKKETLLDLTELFATDSLSHAVSEYVDAQDTLVAAQQEQITRLNSIVDLQDSLIASDRTHIQDLKGIFETSLTQQQVLTDQNLQIRKELKREKRKSTLWKLGTVLVAGAAATLLIIK